MVDSLGDVIVELANNGSDTVNAAIDYSLGAELEHLHLIGTALIGSGNKLANTLTGNAENNSLFGFDGADRLIGNEGDDSLEGGFGADTLLGGLGNDHYFAVDALDTVTEHSGQGIDTVYTTLNYSLGENLDNVVLLADSEEAFGNALANNLTGNDNNNTLDGGANADTMAGGAGDDDYVVDNSADVVIEAANNGYDRILSSVNFALAANVEALILTGSNDADITGNEFANLLTGNSGNNQVFGLDGDDTLNGGLGLDTLMGGLGDDVYQIERDDDVIIEAQAAGMDTVESSVTYTLVEFVENLTLTGGQDLNGGGNTLDNVLTGNQAANQLQGFAGNDTLTGLQGHDSLYGGTGDDVYVVIYAADSTVIELANEGNDTVQSALTFSLPDDVENLILTGNFSDDPWIVYTDGLGNALDNEITGNDGFNQLYGFDGQDRVDGRAGNDTLDGGDGDDWLFGGSDAVFVANNVSGYGGELLAVNADEMYGGNGNDSLDGGSDDDVLYGDADNDVLYGGDDGSSITEISNNWYGYDYSSAYVYSDGYSGYGGLIFLGNNDTLDGGAGEDKLDGGSGNDALLGGVDSDYLYGGDDGLLNTSNDDYLDGGAGIDTMLGGSGNDVYIVDGSMTVLIPTTFSECHFGSGDDDAGPSLTSISDVVIEYAGEGYDSISSSVSLTLPAHVEALYFTGSANVDVIGNDDFNVLFGNAGNNRLDGGLGADTMAGGLGNDVYFVDNENDAVTEEADAGIDTVRSFLTFYSLGPEFENLDLVANAVTGIGNDADNLLRGNTQANWLEGGLGDDTLTGAGGNDSLFGGLGDDWYVFAKGFGDDTVVDDGGYDQVRFNDHLSLQDVVFSRQADDLVLTLKDSQEHMVLSQWFIGAHKIELFRFCDGTTITDDDIVASLDNHAPVAVDDNLVVQEDTLLAASMNALSNDSDPDLNDKLSLTTAATVAGLYGVWSISATGEVNYQLNNNLPTIQALNAEQQLTEQLSYQISDDNRVKPLTAEAMLSVTILGTNDVPVAETDANAVQEDLSLTASGNVLANDTDIDANAVLRVASSELSNSAYGQLLVNAEGGYQYTLNNEQLIVQALPAWQQLDDVFNYTVSDGISSASGQLVIRVTGNNDAPMLVQPLVDQAAQVGAAWAYTVPAGTFAI
ncbi:VCBS domain-containing protein [Methylocucumis oryzae]|uniref:Cadherin domain-containing protein n=1 Tax=Methylocucumis oryzae TaxID=1632867 RepID=A0A0F3IFV7_9GAMM|nr:VCBS domain-containing protein [Methylocucumis oryzae]KJV05626.1 hypothetical protein VZ94_16800 [Methylocucumis oryzae]